MALGNIISIIDTEYQRPKWTETWTLALFGKSHNDDIITTAFCFRIIRRNLFLSVIPITLVFSEIWHHQVSYVELFHHGCDSVHLISTSIISGLLSLAFDCSHLPTRQQVWASLGLPLSLDLSDVGYPTSSDATIGTVLGIIETQAPSLWHGDDPTEGVFFKI